MRYLKFLLFSLALAGVGCEGGETPGSNDSSAMDAGVIPSTDADVSSQAKRQTAIIPVSGAARTASSKFQGHISVTAPQPVGQTSSDIHQATISISGETQ